MDKLFMGLYVGVYNARAIVLDEKGNVRAKQERPFKNGYFERDPNEWWNAAAAAISACIDELGGPDDILVIAASGIAGEIVPILKDMTPYTVDTDFDEERAYREANRVYSEGRYTENNLGFKFSDAFALPKLMWYNNRLDIYKFICQSDFIMGKLTGRFDISDTSNAVKMGLDSNVMRWQSFLGRLGIDRSVLPHVVFPGTLISRVSDSASKATGLSKNTRVIAGAMDSYAACLSAGVTEVGGWSVGIGSMLTIKGCCSNHIVLNHLFSRRQRSGNYETIMEPHSGLRFVYDLFPPEEAARLRLQAAELTPTDCICYPLMGRGECFPFEDSSIQGFFVGDISDDATMVAAAIEGLGLMIRLCLDELNSHGSVRISDEIHIGTAAPTFLDKPVYQVLANILGRSIRIPKNATPETGLALLGASRVMGSWSRAVRAMIHDDYTVRPDKRIHEQYEPKYNKFKGILMRSDVRRYFYKWR